ncbi:MAG: ComEC/Rec2 family competence protein [Chloroflexota bacterium]
MGLVYLAVAWLAGTYLGLLAGAPLAAPIWFAGALLLAAVWWRRPRLRFVLLAAGVVALGFWRGAVALEPPGEGHVALLNGQDVSLRGVVQGPPTIERGGLRYLLAVEEATSPDGQSRRHGLVRVVASRFPDVREGDILAVEGRLEAPPQYDAFAYRDYLARQDVHSLLLYPRFIVLASPGAQGPWAMLSEWRASLAATLARALPEPQSALAASLLVGDTGRLPEDVIAAFRLTGTGHILAVSGWQVSIVIGLLTGLAGALLRWRTVRFAVVAAGVLLYASLAGGTPGVARAALMAGVALMALQLGRPRDSLIGLAVACVALTAFRPQSLLDVGLQLSAVATLGIVVLTPRLQSAFRWAPPWLATTTATTFAAQIAVWPITVVDFGLFSPVGLLVNLLAVPLVPAALEWSALTALLGLVWAPLGVAAGWVAWLFLSPLLWLVEAAARFDYVSLNVPRLPQLLPLIYYGLLFLMLEGGRSVAPVLARTGSLLPPVPRRLVLSVGAGLAVVLGGALGATREQTWRVSVLDVGQGDAILLQSPSGYRILVDGGPDGVALTNTLDRRLPHWDKTLDLVVLTHAHDDHLGGLIDVLGSHSVRQVLQGPAPPQPSPSYKRWSEQLQSRAIPSHEARTGQAVALEDGARLVVRYAGEAWDGSPEDLNDTSLVVCLEVGTVAFYLLGDAGPDAQRALLHQGLPSTFNLLKVPHHGAAGSLDGEFVRALAPAAVFLAVGQSNRFGHPAADTLSQLGSVPVYRTDLHGSLEVVLAPGGFSVATSR